MTINRPVLLNKLISAQHNDFVKIITGVRRCGKSYLLFNLFKRHLLATGHLADHIIEIDLEREEFKNLRTPAPLYEYIMSRIVKDGKWNYVLIDEIQLCRKVRPRDFSPSEMHPDDIDDCWDTFYSILSELRTMPHVDCYVTGSNSKMLSTDVATEFRGRGQIIHVTPLSFAEFRSCRTNEANVMASLIEYLTYGGMPECVLLQNTPERQSYLSNLYTAIYLRDIVNRHKLHGDTILSMTTDAVMSMVGGLTNPTKIVNFLKASQNFDCSHHTLVKHLDYLADAFLISKAVRYDVRGKHYLDYPAKYYATDTGLRNARTGFRQIEFTHLMENVIYNELLRNGYAVDIGVVGLNKEQDGKHIRSTHEIDFVVNRGYERIYIQSAWMIPDAEKMAQETFSLKHTGDNFKKVVIDGQYSATYRDNDGIGHISLTDFLLNPKALETL